MPLYYWLANSRTVAAVAVFADTIDAAKFKVVEEDQKARATGSYLLPGNVLDEVLNTNPDTAEVLVVSGEQ